MSTQTGSINQAFLKKLKQEINKYSPHPKQVKIIAVTKNRPFSSIMSAVKNNIYNIGENKVQETEQKTTKKTKPQNLQMHFIGQIQTNKIKKAVHIYDLIQSVDTHKKIIKINKEASKIKKKQKILLQVNIAKNKNQGGATPKELISLYNTTKQQTNVELKGIMSIGPNTTNTKRINKHFQETNKIFKKLKKQSEEQITEISAGMSQDYIPALKHGATMLRIGTKLFS